MHFKVTVAVLRSIPDVESCFIPCHRAILGFRLTTSVPKVLIDLNVIVIFHTIEGRRPSAQPGPKPSDPFSDRARHVRLHTRNPVLHDVAL